MEDLKARCIVDAVTHCWLWQGGTTGDGSPKLHTLDYDRLEKRTMPGTRAAWSIAFGKAPRPGCIVFRACLHRLCLNPAHLREGKSKAELGQHIRRSGAWKGTYIAQRTASARKASLAAGTIPTPEAVVRAIRQEPRTTMNVTLAERYGIAHQTVSRIRRGQSRKDVSPNPSTVNTRGAA